jgi:hypothetical protein
MTYVMNNISEKPCSKCGVSNFWTCYSEKIQEKLLRKQICFTCNFWTEIIEKKDLHIFIEGSAYAPLDVVKNNVGLGYGGKTFYYYVFDNKEFYKCNNLRFRGEIPELFRKDLPDTGVFCTEKEYDNH